MTTNEGTLVHVKLTDSEHTSYIKAISFFPNSPHVRNCYYRNREGRDKGSAGPSVRCASAITVAPPIVRMAVPFSIRSRKNPVTERISECVEFLLQFPALRFSPIVEILQAMLNFLGFEDLADIKNIARRATY